MHTFIAGSTGCGKTFLQKALARQRRAQGYGVLVCDPMRESGWDCDRLVTSGPEMLTLAKASRQCAIFFSEAASSIGRNGGDLNWFAEASRHLGHRCYFGSQRMTQVDPIIRDNCDELFLFRVRTGQADYWAEHFSDDVLLGASELGKYEFMLKKPFETVRISMLMPDGQSLVTVSKGSQ